jgi:hypothetical protein
MGLKDKVVHSRDKGSNPSSSSSHVYIFEWPIKWSRAERNNSGKKIKRI